MLTAIYPFVLLAHAFILMRAANRLDSEIVQAKNAAMAEAADGPLKVVDGAAAPGDVTDDEEDDKTEVGSTV